MKFNFTSNGRLICSDSYYSHATRYLVNLKFDVLSFKVSVSRSQIFVVGPS